MKALKYDEVLLKKLLNDDGRLEILSEICSGFNAKKLYTSIV
jgi:hypothetical protein